MGCESVYFYLQAARGQSELLVRQTSTEELLKSNINPVLRGRIERVEEILRFAEELGLPAEGAYSSYIETGQLAVIWNVFASRPYELALKTSCFPVAGCVTYRGYFRQEDAQDYARGLEDKGYEVYIGGVAAYSTLGWFKDPLLDTFLFRPDKQLAALLFHELSHRVVYVKGDTRFNESLATTIELYALKEWFLAQNEPGLFDQLRLSLLRKSSVIELIMETRNKLELLYESRAPIADMETKKKEIIREMKDAYARMRASWSVGNEFSYWMEGPITNAKLETVSDYNEWVPVLTIKLQQLGFDQFKTELLRLAALSRPEREVELRGFKSGDSMSR